VGGGNDEGIYLFLFVPFLLSPCVQFSFAFVRCLNFHIYITGDERVAGWELRHLAGSPGGGGGIRSCHSLIRVHTV
jgi:hypothetical protein